PPYAPTCIIMRTLLCPCQPKKCAAPTHGVRAVPRTFAPGPPVNSQPPQEPRRASGSMLFTMSDPAPSRLPDDSQPSRAQALLDVAGSIVHTRHAGDLVRDLTERVHRVDHFDFLVLVLHAAARQVMRLHIL